MINENRLKIPRLPGKHCFRYYTILFARARAAEINRPDDVSRRKVKDDKESPLIFSPHVKMRHLHIRQIFYDERAHYGQYQYRLKVWNYDVSLFPAA